MVRVPDILFHYSINEIAHMCGVSLKTAQRWKRGQAVPPRTAIMILSRDLGVFNPAWKGWIINRVGELCSPENWIATPGDVLSIQLTQAQLSAYRTENRHLKAELEAKELGFFEEQPLPENWSIALES
jgi:transcriptional regulator with XRE-family HTH domain